MQVPGSRQRGSTDRRHETDVWRFSVRPTAFAKVLLEPWKASRAMARERAVAKRPYTGDVVGQPCADCHRRVLEDGGAEAAVRPSL